ncbi:MAG: peptide ABC transporter substrate-binding protein [Chlamydiales bacterium]|nr:peptide ABC transporter substrate-binding protein [Chlamydiales bacterium]
MTRAILFFLLLAPLYTGCHSKSTASPYNPSREQIFRLNSHSEPTSLDPRLVRDIPSVTTSKMLFDGLTRMTQAGPALSIAEKVEISEDFKTYTFYLKETFWTNGEPVTAYDFERAWKSILDPLFPAEFAHQLFILENGAEAKRGKAALDSVGVEALDARTLIARLTHPNPYFLQLTAFPICYPVCRSLDANWASAQGDGFVCNGPFKLAHWRHGSELKVIKNYSYWENEAVHLDAIVMTMIEDEHTELNMYENDELDWAGSPNSSIPPEALPSLKAQRQNELFIEPIAGTYCFKFNTKEPPFDSLKMRRAFSAAINRSSLIENVLQANQQVACSLLPPCMRPAGFQKPEISFSDGDEMRALELFEEALAEKGWTRETLPPITLMFSRSEKHQKTAQAAQQSWNKTFGIKINLQSYEWNTFIDRLSKHHYQIGGRGWVSDLLDPMTLLELYKFTNDSDLGGNNDTQWEDPQFIALLEEALATPEPDKRDRLLDEAEKILMRDLPIAPLYHSTACYLKKPYVKEVYLSELCDLDFKHAYIER